MKITLLVILLLASSDRTFAGSATYNEIARFLAGLPVSGPLKDLENDPEWTQHARFFDEAWNKLERRQLAPIRGWSADYLKEACHSHRPVFYVFSGPDFLYAHSFFPSSDNYVLCGIEPVGSLPDIGRIPNGAVGSTLRNLEASLNSVFNYSFFITKEMRVNLQTGPINGTLPILFVFLARMDCVVRDVEFVSKGVKITFSLPGGSGTQALYYFNTDLSNGAANGGFFKFCESLGTGTGFTKSASYLMHQNDFSQVRNWMLDHCETIVQDDSGIPINNFDPQHWRLRLFGIYTGPIDIFKQHYQPQLADLYKTSSPAPLDFGIGYRGWNPKLSTLTAAFRR